MSLSAEQIFMQVQAGQVPATWQLFTGRATHFLRQIFTGLFIGALGGLGFYMYFVQNTYFYHKILSFLSEEVLIWISLVVYAVLALWGVITFILNLIGLLGANGHLLVSTPEGFALKVGSTPEYYAYAQYAVDIEKDKDGEISFYVQQHGGDRQELSAIDGRFGKEEDVVNTLYHAYVQYTQAQQAGVSQAQNPQA